MLIRKLLLRPSMRDLLLILVVPLVLVLINNNWIFSPASTFPDTWFYYSYFHYFYDFVGRYPSNVHYFVERLSWVVPGYWFYHLFPPLTANYALHLSVYYTAALSLYGTLRLLFNRRAALITTLLMAGYPWFLRAVGWDYVDGVGIAYCLLLLFLLTLATKQAKHRKPILFGAGFVSTLLLVSNPFWVGLSPAIVGYFVLAQTNLSRRFFLDSLVIVFGAVVGFLLLALFYYRLTGAFFLSQSFGVSDQLVHKGTLNRFLLEYYGQMAPYWHLLPVLVAISSIPFLLLPRHSADQHRSFIGCLVLFALSYGWFIFWQFYAAPYLSVYLYSSYVIPGTFLLLGSLLAWSIETLADQKYASGIVATSIIVIAPLLIFTLFPGIAAIQGNGVLIALCSIGFIALVAFRRKAWVSLPLIALTVSLTGFLGDSNFIPQVFIADRFKNMNNFLAVEKAMSAINSKFPDVGRYNSFKLWYRKDENVDTDFALASAYLYPWGNAVMGQKPGLKWPGQVELLNNDNVIILASDENALTEASTVLGYPPVNAAMELKSQVDIDQGDIHITMFFTKITRVFDINYTGRFYFRQGMNGPGWYAPEDINGTIGMWSGPGTTSSMTVRLPGLDSDAILRICLLDAAAPDIASSLRVNINDVPIELQPVELNKCKLGYGGIVPHKLLADDSNDLVLAFRVNRTVSYYSRVEGMTKKFGLAFSWIRFMPAPAEGAPANP